MNGISTKIITLDVNGESHQLEVSCSWTLLKVIRDKLGLTGTKSGCDFGECGSCTVLVDGKAVLSCLTLAVDVEGMRWMKVSLVSWSPAVPGSDFRLLAKSHSSGRFLELPPIG